MRAICVNSQRKMEVREIPRPEHPAADHLLIRMETCTINSGDKAFLRMPSMAMSTTQHGIWGASGSGTVVEIGAGVPESYRNQRVIVYKPLVRSEHIVGTWSEYSQLHYLTSAIVPKTFGLPEFDCSLVNLITPYAFAKQIVAEGHRGILVTAGNSATGRAMLGIGEALGLPIVSLVRDQKGRDELLQLKASHVLVINEPDFGEKLAAVTAQVGATAVFDGVGAALIGEIIALSPANSTLYSYGYLSGLSPLSLDLVQLMMKNTTGQSLQ